LPVKAGWRGVKPSLDALIGVAAAGSKIKAGVSHRSMRIVRLAGLIAPRPESSLRRTIPTGEAQPVAFQRQGNPDAYERITVF
jgi:hypothetical protein